MTIEIRDQTSGQLREIVDWYAGSPIYAGQELPTKPDPRRPVRTANAIWFWPLKPGDLVCDWLGVVEADNRGLLRLFVNLALYSKIVAGIALLIA